MLTVRPKCSLGKGKAIVHDWRIRQLVAKTQLCHVTLFQKRWQSERNVKRRPLMVDDASLQDTYIIYSK